MSVKREHSSKQLGKLLTLKTIVSSLITTLEQCITRDPKKKTISHVALILL